LGSELRTRNASHPRDGPLRRLVGNVCRCWVAWLGNRLRASGGREFGGAHGSGMESMSKFQAQVPDPLREDLPTLLTAGHVRTPAVRILLLILIREKRLECSPVQVELHHIGRGERTHRQGCVEQLVDHLATRGADFRRSFGHGMCSDDDSCAWSRRGQEQPAGPLPVPQSARCSETYALKSQHGLISLLPTPSKNSAGATRP